MPRRTARDARRRVLGQNFLHDPAVIADVVGTLHPPPGALVVDLGAGRGALTRAAAARGHRVHAVELDPDWARRLRAQASAWGDVRVVRGDALAVTLPDEPFFVVSSAPYGIGTKLVRRLLTDAHGLQRAAVVLQRETAHRLAGRPRTGRFAATWAPWFELGVGRRIPARAFRPVPSVDSAVLTLAPRETPLLSPAAFAPYTRFVDAAFTGRARRIARPGSIPPEDYAALFRRGACSPSGRG